MTVFATNRLIGPLLCTTSMLLNWLRFLQIPVSSAIGGAEEARSPLFAIVLETLATMETNIGYSTGFFKIKRVFEKRFLCNS